MLAQPVVQLSTRDTIIAYATTYGTKVLVAIVVFCIGRLVARAAVRGLERLMERSHMDVSLRKFLGDVLYAGLVVAIIIAALDTAGVHTTAMVAVLGAAGLAVGLALQGSLSNFAAGVMIIVLRPYKVGDTVVIGTYEGTVQAIKVFNSVLATADNREVIIPNGQIIGGPIENLTTRGARRIDILISVRHGADLGAIKRVLEGALQEDPRILGEPAPALELAAVTEGSVKLHLRPWVKTEAYAAVATETLERIRVLLDAQPERTYTVGLA